MDSQGWNDISCMCGKNEYKSNKCPLRMESIKNGECSCVYIRICTNGELVYENIKAMFQFL